MKNSIGIFLLTISLMGLSLQKGYSQGKPTLTEAWCDFETYDGGNDKDNDSRIELSYSVTYPTGIVRVFALAPKDAYGRFPDGSSNRVPMKVQGTPTIDDIVNNPGKFTLKFEPKGDDTWKFHYVVRMKFSDGTLLDVKSGNFKEVSDHARGLTE